MELTRRQFLAGLVRVATVVTAVCVIPDCIPLANPHKAQPIHAERRFYKWRVIGATHLALRKDGDSILVDGRPGERIKITRVEYDVLDFESDQGPKELVQWSW